MIVCLGVVSMSGLLSCDKSQSSLVSETPREGIYENLVPLGSVFRHIKGVERNPLPTFAIFQGTSTQNNQYTKAAYFAVPCA